MLNSSTDVLVSNSNSLGFGNRRGTTSSLTFSNSNYGILEDIRSTVAEWNSSISSTMANNLIVGYTSNNENRTQISQPWFPEVEILQAGQPFTTFGFEPFTPANQLTYHSAQFQDNFTIYLPKNSLTFGVSVEQYHSKNVFFPGAQSVYVYDSLVALLPVGQLLHHADHVRGLGRAAEPARVPVPVREHPRRDRAGAAAGRDVLRHLRAG